MATILIERFHKRTGKRYYKRIQRRATWLSGNLYEYRYQHQRCYCLLTHGQFVSSAQQQCFSYPFKQAA